MAFPIMHMQLRTTQKNLRTVQQKTNVGQFVFFEHTKTYLQS